MIDLAKKRIRERRYREARKVKKYGPDSVGVDMRGRHGRHGMEPEHWEGGLVPIEKLPTAVSNWAVAVTGCWLWRGSVMPQIEGRSRPGDYGRVYWDGRYWQAHRLVYEMLKGVIPKGHQLDHLCRVPRCVNPLHLEPVTPGENTRRGSLWQREKTSCPAGHPYDVVTPKQRACSLCSRSSRQRYQDRKRAALPKDPEEGR